MESRSHRGTQNGRDSRRLRLWPAGLILVLWAVVLVWTWWIADHSRQHSVLHGLLATVAAAALLLLWFLLASKAPWRWRLGALALAVAAGGLAANFVEIQGVTGDLVPILGWKAGGEEEPPEPEESPGESAPDVGVSMEAAAEAGTAEVGPLSPGPDDDAAAGASVEVELSGTEVESGPDPASGAASEASQGSEAIAPAGDELVVAATAVNAPVPLTPAAPDYPQFLGPTRDARLPGPALDPDWASHPPEEIWRRPVGAAWSAFAIAGDRAVTQEQQGVEEQVTAYALATGEVLWRHSDTTRYETTIGGIGPRATPTLAGGRVYTLGATGLLNALDLETGRKLWSRDVLAENGAGNREWGKSGSPLVVDGLVVVSAGGRDGRSLVAYDAETGGPVWAAGDDTSSYSSPVLATLGGRRQVVIRNQTSITGHEVATGEVLWSESWTGEFPNVAVPVFLGGDRMLVSTGYGIGSKLFRVESGAGGFELEELWASSRLKAKFTNVVVHEGYVYGLDDGVLVCLDPRDGERCWKKGRFGHGQMILVGELLLVTTERGEVLLLDPDPEEYRELGRFRAFSGKSWNPPALAGRHLLLRTDQEAALYRLPVR